MQGRHWQFIKIEHSKSRQAHEGQGEFIELYLAPCRQHSIEGRRWGQTMDVYRQLHLQGLALIGASRICDGGEFRDDTWKSDFNCIDIQIRNVDSIRGYCNSCSQVARPRSYPSRKKVRGNEKSERHLSINNLTWKLYFEPAIFLLKTHPKIRPGSSKNLRTRLHIREYHVISSAFECLAGAGSDFAY